MKNFIIPVSLVLSVTSCSALKLKKPDRTPQNLSETTQINESDIFENATPPEENTHELAEATVDDVVITQAKGAEIDEEMEPSVEEQIPYSRDFLAQRNTKRMQFWVEYFTQKQRERFQRFINNGEEYRHHIEKVFVENNLPKELYYVGLIESGYYLGAKSHASAVGPWQFIRGTASRYGLRMTKEVDERQDLFKASRAAAKYFKDLHNIFSSWELALAAYNAGEYGIIRRIMKHGTRDFYELSKRKLLPAETINYVPKVLAAMHVVKNAEKYGFIIPKKSKKFFDHTELKAVKKNVSLKTIARRLNVDLAVLKKLNPELRKSSTPRYLSGTYFLRVPGNGHSPVMETPMNNIASNHFEKPESRKEINRRTASAPKKVEIKEETPSEYKVRSGDTLISISRKFKTTPRALAEANGFSSWRTRVQIGQVLQLEKSDSPVVKVANLKVTKKPIVYKVKSGDNLTDLSRIFNIKLASIKKANKLKRGRILVGQKLILPSTKKGIYTVKPGDHLTKVSQEFNLPIEALVKLNKVRKNQIYPGQKLIVNID